MASLVTTTVAGTASITATTNDGSTAPLTVTQAGTARAAYVTRNVASATRAMADFGQLSASGGAHPALHIQQTTTASDALRITSDGSTAKFAVTGTGALTATSGTFIGANTNAATYATFKRSDAAVSARIRYDGVSTILIGTSTNHPISFETNATPRLSISAAGAATFSGSITGGGFLTLPNTYGLTWGDITNRIEGHSTNNTVDIYTNNTLAFSLSAAQSATFSGALSGTTAAFTGAVTSTDGLLSNYHQIYATGTTGFLIATNIVANNYGFIFGEIKLEQFNVSSYQTINFSCTVLPAGTVYSKEATADIAVTIKLFNYGGKWYVWVPSPSTFTTISAYVNLGSGYQGTTRGQNAITSVSAAAVPGSGVTNSIDLVARQRIIADTSGKVGIGTAANLNSILNVYGGTSSGPTSIITCMSANATVGGGAGIFFKASNNHSLNRYGAQVSAIRNSSNNGSADLVFNLEKTDVTGLAERMRIKGDGNVGIGTTAPDNPLEVVGADSGIKISSASSNRPHLRFECGTAEKMRLSANSVYGAIGDSSDANRYMAFKDGNVGIGITTPGAKFHVTGAPGNSTYLSYLFNSATHSQAHGLNVQIASSGAAAYGLRVNTGGDTIALAVMGNGRVGIGTAAPSAKLAIDNSTDQLGLFIDSDYRENTRFHSTESGQGTRVWITNSSITSNKGYGFVVGDATGGADKMTIGPFDSGGSYEAENITLTRNGNVGIGTTSPGAKLMVGAPTRQAGTAVQQQAGYFIGTKTAFASSAYKGLWQNQLHVADDSALAAGIGGAITFGATQDNTNGTYLASIEGSKDNATSGQYGASMIFRTRTNGVAAMGAHMVIASDGNVGIGTIVPSCKIHAESTGANKCEILATEAAGAFKAVLGVQNSPGVVQAAYVGSLSNTTFKILTNGVSRVVVGTDGSMIITGALTATTGTFAGHVTPSSNVSYNLGSSGLRWLNIYGSAGNFSGTLTASGAANIGGALTGTSAAFSGAVELTGGARLMSGQRLLGQTSGVTSTQLIYWGGTDAYYGRVSNSPENGAVASHIFRAAGTTRLTISGTGTAVVGAGSFTGGLTATTGTFAGHVTPSSNVSYNLGSSGLRWLTIYGNAGNFSGTVTANAFSGNGASLTSLNGSNISSGTVAVARLGLSSIASTISPSVDSTYSLGANTTRWASVFADTLYVTNVIAASQLGSGSSITSKFLRGDNTWQTVSSGSGDITGVTAGTTLSGGGTSGSVTINHANHTGEVTGSGSLTIAGNVVDEANLKVSNSPTNGYVLTARSGNTGGMTWEAASGGGGSGTVTEVTVGTGLDVSNGTTTPNITLDLAELSTAGSVTGTDDFVVIDGSSTRKEQMNTIGLSGFSGYYGLINKIYKTSAGSYITPDSSGHIEMAEGTGVSLTYSSNKITFATGTSSDYRIKKNISTFNSDAWAKVKSVNLRKFDFDEDAFKTAIDSPDPEIVGVPKSYTDNVGFIAHELAEVRIDGAVIGEKDAVDSDGNLLYQKVNYNALVPVLWGALNEAISKIETLESKVQALEDK